MRHAYLSAMAVLAAAATATSATTINPTLATPISLGIFAAGTYHIGATGLIDLLGPPGSGFTIRPDGVPDVPITAVGYGYFNPSGSYVADGNAGPGGTVGKIGALLGTLTATPTAPADYFLIGFGTNITLGSAGQIYAQVNDVFYSNNGGSFDVTVAAVPDPAVWSLMLGGFVLTGAMLRRRPGMQVVAA